ncbi:MAG: LysM peptidoglycan-binding domain-containing protein [Flavobacteriales bacterium]|nr:LysM peptidoglycan-binding domain-containing protein [Flavobacteriales bacterium]
MRTLLVIFGLICVVNLSAQTKVIHDGEACYLHVVEKGNTLYGISKQYAIDIPDLLEMNPEAEQNLSIGQKVFIPIRKVNRKQAKKSPTLEGNLLVHKVAKKETLYSLSKKYRVEINAILEANPGLEKDGLKKGSLIRIPTISAQVDEDFTTPAVKDSLLHHEVIPGETLYSLSKNYEVSIDSIRAVNGGLEEGLRAGMTLRIPRYTDGFDSSQLTLEEDTLESTLELERNPRLQMNLGLLLPFTLSSSDSTDRVLFRKPDDIMKMTDIAYEFYRGFRIGMDELSRYGLSANVVVKDVSNNRSSVEKVLRSSDIEDLDFIIGPLHKESFEMMSNDKDMRKVFRASPLSASLDINSSRNEKVARVKTSDLTMIGSMLDHVRAHHEGENVILIGGDIRSWHNQVEDVWYKDTTSMNMTDSLRTIRWDRKNKSKLIEMMDVEGPNVLIFPVEHRPSITDLISHLAMTEYRDLEITLYGLESWMKYDNLDVDVLDRVDLHIPSSTFIDWESDNVIDFVKTYHDEFNSIPSSSGYALIAYDLTKFYIEGLMMYGPEFLDRQDRLRREGLCSGFIMRKTDSGGWENRFSYMLRYEDYEFQKAP